MSTPTFVDHTWRLTATVLTAHAAAMGREGMIGPDVVDRITSGIGRVREQPADYEDLISLIRGFEERLEAQVTPEVASAARVGRSLVDVSATVARLAVIGRILELDALAGRIEAAAISLAEKNFVTLMPVTMDGFVSQPTSFAHWMGGMIEQTGRARDTLEHALQSVDASPMGSTALASSGFAVDRSDVARALGFNRIVENTFDAVASLDWISAAASAIDTVLSPMRRFGEEIFTWCRADPSAFHIGDWLMDSVPGIPQWTGPFGLVRLNQEIEHVAFQAHVLAHEAASVSYGPQLASIGRIAYGIDAISIESIGLASEMARFLEQGLMVNASYFSNRAGRGFSTSSDLADFLMIEEKLSPSEAEQIAALTIARARDQGLEAAGITVELIDGAALMVIGRELKVEFEAISRYLAPRRFIERRTAVGAPSPESTRAFVAHRKQDHTYRDEKIAQIRTRFDSAWQSLLAMTQEAATS